MNLGAATRRLAQLLNDSIAVGKSVSAIVQDLIVEGKLVADEDVGRNKAMAKWGGNWLVDLVKKNGTSGEGINVLTVCNTGSLATSVGWCLYVCLPDLLVFLQGYGTALGLITYLHDTRKLGKAYFTQTAPYHQGSRYNVCSLFWDYYLSGSRLTAYELQTLKIPSVMICDTMVGSLFQHHTIHAVGEL